MIINVRSKRDAREIDSQQHWDEKEFYKFYSIWSTEYLDIWARKLKFSKLNWNIV